MKQVIFVGGTSYSGTTLLELILSNDPNGFSCGEVKDYFHPTESHHSKPMCSCGNPECTVWSDIKNNGEDNLYNSIFDMFPNVEFITDSSKDPFWIAKQTKILNTNGIKTKNILIWKTPHEIAESYYKRNRLGEWHKRWVNYHRLYYTMIKDWRSVKCHEFTQDMNVLKEVCGYVNIPYFDDKKEYRKKVSHTLFGNNSARIDIFAKNSNEYINLKERLQFKQEKDKKDKKDIELINKSIKVVSSNNQFVTEIEELLKNRDILCDNNLILDSGIGLSFLSLLWRKSKRSGRYALGKVFYG